jgi:hypothetical protein
MGKTGLSFFVPFVYVDPSDDSFPGRMIFGLSAKQWVWVEVGTFPVTVRVRND